MSSPASTNTPSTILSTIEGDLSQAGQWLESEFESIALTTWGILKNTFYAFTTGQASVMVDLLNKLSSDELSGKSIEQIETDLLTMASSEELALLEGIASSDIQAFIAAWKSTAGASGG